MDISNAKNLSDFLMKNTREDVKIAALHEILALTGKEDGCSLLEDKKLGKLLVERLLDHNELICKTACLCLVNFSASDKGINYLMNAFPSPCKKEIISSLFKHILNPDSTTADAACMTLSNLTRQSHNATLVVNYMVEAGIEFEKIINLFVNLNFNKKSCKLHYLGPLFSNLSQNSEFRRCLMHKNKCLIQKLLPFTQFHQSIIRKSGIVGTLRNCCFDTDYHEWLLGDSVDILPHLLLPLAGPEEFSDEEYEKLPPDLQYLGEDKKREPDPDVRKMLLEAVYQLCATKFGREYLRNKNVYVILREYHKWEKDKYGLLACENIVDTLIRTEEEINEDNLKELEVPEKYVKKFEEINEQYLCDD